MNKPKETTMFNLTDKNIKLESTEPMRISYVPTEENLNVNGTVHGGVMFFLADDLMGRWVTAKGWTGAAADAEIHYYVPALPGERIFATIDERKVGRRLGVLQVEITNEAGKRIADAVFTLAFASAK